MLLCSFNLVSILTAFVVVAALLEGEPSHPGQHASTFHFTSSTLKRATKYAVLFNTSMHRFAKNANSDQCADKVESALLSHSRSLLEDDVYPFENVRFHSRCPDSAVVTVDQAQMPIGRFIINNSKRDAHVPYTNTSLSPDTIAIAYILLTHSNPTISYRLITSLNSSNTVFIVHVDGKASDVFDNLTALAGGHENVYFVQDRQVLTWGGYSIVNATLQAMHLLVQLAIPYDYVVTLSGTTYPIKSNTYIKQVLTRDPHMLYMDLLSKPFRPPAHLWHQYIECDDALHRIARFSLPRGINMYQGSQWFALPRDVVQWLLSSKLTSEFAEYAQYIVVPDENFFSTLVINSPYCSRPRQNSLTFLLFDQWENEKVGGDMKKCVGWGNKSCGRSPLTLTYTEHKHLVQASWALFARKFDPSLQDSMRLIDYIDKKRGHVDPAERAMWDSNRSHDDQQAVAIRVLKNSHCLQIDKQGNKLSAQVCTRKLNQQFATRGCYRADDEGGLVCMIQAVGAFDTCITVPVRDRKIIVADKEVKMDNCQGTWNQLFRLPSSSSTGFILQQPWDQSANPEQSYCLEYLPALQSTNTVVAIVACKYSAIGQFFALEDLTTD